MKVLVRNDLLLPSLVFVTDDGHLLFGDEAQTAADCAEPSGREAFISPKQYLSTDELQALDEKLEANIDPSRQFTPRGLLILFLAHLLAQASRAAAQSNLPWPVPLPIARPAWERRRAAIGEATLRSLVLRAFTIVDALGSKLIAVGGLGHDARLQGDVLQCPHRCVCAGRPGGTPGPSPIISALCARAKGQVRVRLPTLRLGARVAAEGRPGLTRPSPGAGWSRRGPRRAFAQGRPIGASLNKRRRTRGRRM